MRLKLYWSPVSPYVRKAMIAAHELGVADRLETIATTPESIVADVAADNPLCQIPTLVLADGSQIYDSLAIIDYLNAEAGGTLIPARGAERWSALTRHALGQGLIDAANRRRTEERRPAGEQSPDALAKLRATVERALDALERSPPPDAPDIGGIAAAAGLGYLDLRFPAEPWRPGRPRLAAWFEVFGRRPSMVATAPRL